MLRQSKTQHGCGNGLLSQGTLRSAGLDVLVQGSADSAGACEQLLGHGLDLLAQTDGVQVHAEDIGAAVQSLQAGEVLLAGFHLQGSHDGLQLSQQRVSGDLEGLTVVVDALQVAGIACQHQRGWADGG